MADYGVDLNMVQRPDGILDFPEDGGTIAGDDTLAVVQAIVIRLSTERGSVLDAPDDGICLTDWLSRAMDATEAASLAGVIESEIRKEERVIAVRAVVDISELYTANAFSVDLSLDLGAGPFPLTLGVSAAGVAILGGA